MPKEITPEILEDMKDFIKCIKEYHYNDIAPILRQPLDDLVKKIS